MLLFCRPEHDKAQDEQKEGKTNKNARVDNLFHPQHNDLCL